MKYLLILFSFMLLQNSVVAQSHQIIITVIDDFDKPVSGAEIVLNNTTINNTDLNGRCIFKNVVNGNYNIKVSLIGHKPVNRKLEVSGHDKSLTIRLHPQEHILKEVVVHNLSINKRKSEEQLNLEIVKKDFIQQHLGGSLMQSLQRLPGIKTIGIGSGQSKPLIRGLGFNRVVVLDKGIKHEGQQWGADHGLEVDQFGIDEVEILKGAASFAYGSDAIGGAINIKTPALPAQNSFGADVTLIGKTNNNLYGGSANIYRRKNNWLVTARATMLEYGDYRVPTDKLYVYDYEVNLYKNYLRNTAGRETGLHISAGYVGDAFKSIFYVSNVYSKSGFFANAHGLEPRRVDAPMHDRSSRDILMPYQTVNHLKIINRSSLRISNHFLEMETGYQNNFRNEFNNYVSHGYMPPTYPDSMRTIIPKNLEREFNKDVYSFNLRDKVQLNKHELQVGVNAELQNNFINGWSFLVPAFNQKAIGAYAYDKFKINDKLLLHGALRFDHIAQSINEYADWFQSPIVQNGDTTYNHAVRAIDQQKRFNSITGSIGINYNLELIELKANIGKSFRAPIVKELGANGVNYHYFSYEKGNANLNPEESYQFDATAILRKNKWEVQLSPFVNYFPNYIYLNPTAEFDYLYGAGNQIYNYSQSEVFRLGGEFQVKYQALENLSASLLGEYLYAQQLSGDKKGYTLPFSPPASALLNITYQPIHLEPFHRTYFSIDYRATASQKNIVPPERKTEGYHLFNVQAGTRFYWQKQELKINLQLQNVFNTRYLNHTSFYRLIGLPEQGRNFILSVNIPFNFNKQTN